MAEDGLILIHKDATKGQVQVTPASFTGKTSDTIDYDGLALPNFLPTILDSDGLNEVIKAIDTQLGIVATNITTGDAAQVSNSLFDANTILKADVDDTPLALTVPVDTIIGRKTGGNIAALSPTDVLTVLGITASIAELNFVDGVTSAIQTQIDGNDTDITNLQAKFPVVTADIADSAVTNVKLANNAVSSAKLDSSLQTDITQITTNKDNITTLTNLTTIAEQTIFGRRTGDSTAIGLTATQTLTLLGITVSATDINQLTGINDNVQVQIDNISDTFGNIDAFDEVTIIGLTAPTSVDLIHIIIAGIAFINNKRVSTSDTSHTYAASKDTYVDLDDGGTFTFIEVGNGDDAPTLTTNSIRLMKVVTDVDNITGVTDLRPLDLRIDKLLGRKMDIPTGVTATLQSGGSLTDGTELFYVVTATDGSGETIQSTEVSETPTGGNLTIKIDWTAVTKAKFYNVYRRASGIYKLFKQVTAPTITLTDDGSAIFVSAGSPPLFTNAYRAKLEDIGDVTLEIGSTDITSGTVGRILFEGTGNFLQESANLAWDNATSVLTVTGDSIVTKHMAIGANAVISSGDVLQLNETITSGSTFTGINSSVTLNSTNATIDIVGASFDSTVNGTTGASNIFGVKIQATSNITAGFPPDLVGLRIRISVSDSSLAPTTSRVLSISAPDVIFAGQLTTHNGITIENQGATEITTSTALKIRDQSGSTNSYSIITGTGRIGFNQSTPASSVHITGEGTTNETTALLVENSVGTNSLIVLDNGDVGIGVTPINTQLHIGGSASQFLRLESTASANSTEISCWNDLGTGDRLLYTLGGSTAAGLNFGISNNNLGLIVKQGNGNFVIGTAGSGFLVLGANGTEVVRIDSTPLMKVTGDAQITKHAAIGANASVDDNFILRINETITLGSAVKGISSDVNLVSTSNLIDVTGASISATMSGTIGGTDVIGLSITAHSNVTAGVIPNVIGLTINVFTDSGASSPAETRALNIGSPLFIGGKPPIHDGVNIVNQGVSGVTTSTAINIAAQTGSTNNFGIDIAGTSTRNRNAGTREELITGLSLSNGNNNNVSTVGISSRITGPTAAFTITGIAGGEDGKIIELINTLSFNMTIADEDTNSTASNRIITSTGSDRTTIGIGVVRLRYDGSSSRWRIISFDTTTKKAIVIASLTRDETHAVATDVSPVSFVVPFGGLFQIPYAEIETAGTTGLLTVNIKKNGTTIFTTKITIDSGELTSRTAATPPVIVGGNTFNKFDKFTVDIDGIHTTPGKGLTIYIPIDITDF